MAISSEIADGLTELEGDFPATFVWNSTTYTAIAGPESRSVEAGEFGLEQIDSLKTVDVEQNYIDKVIQMNKRQREVQLKENGFWSGSLERLDFNGVDPRLLIQYPALVEQLTAATVREAAARYFDLDHYVRVVLYPEGFGDPPSEADAGPE